MKGKSFSSLITPLNIIELGNWYTFYCKTGEIKKFEGKVMITDSLDGQINGYNPGLKMLKGYILYPEALEEIFKMVKAKEGELPSYL